MKQVLRLTLFREHFAAIAARKKRVEYRRRIRYQRARLEGRKNDVICFRNGYSSRAPEMLMEFRGLLRYGEGRNAYYDILLGNVLSIKRWRA